MPIIVREIVVKATIGEQDKKRGLFGLGANNRVDEDAIVAKCIDQVSRILKESKRR